MSNIGEKLPALNQNYIIESFGKKKDHKSLLNFCGLLTLRINPLDRPREWDRLADVLRAADPGDGALDTHAEA